MGRGSGASEAFSVRDNPNRPVFYLYFPQTGEINMGIHPLPLGKIFKCDGYRHPRGNTHAFNGFNRLGFNRHGVNRAGYDMDGRYRGHQHGTVIPSAMTGAMFGRHVQRGVSIDREPALSVEAAREQRGQRRRTGACKGARGHGS